MDRNYQREQRTTMNRVVLVEVVRAWRRSRQGDNFQQQEDDQKTLFVGS